MARGISIEFLANVAGFLRGTKHVEEALNQDVLGALEDVQEDGERIERVVGDAFDEVGRKAKDAADELDDVAKAGKDVGDDVERGGKDAEAALEDATRTGREFRDALEDVSKKARTTGDDVGKNMKRGADEAADGLGEMKDEADGIARETASSFDGSADSIMGAFQDLAANAFVGFGAAGALAGLGIAAGLGTAWTRWQEDAERIEQRTKDMYADMLASGQDYLSAQYVNTEIDKILQDAEDAVISYAEAQTVAAETGRPLAQVLRAYAGDAESLAAVQGVLTERATEQTAAFRDATQNGLNPWGAAAGETGTELAGLADRLTDVNSRTADVAGRTRAAREAMLQTSDAASDYAQAVAGQADSYAAATQAIQENNAALLDGEDRQTANVAALAELSDELRGVQDSALAAGAQSDELTALQADQARQFRDTATAAGIERDAALDLAVQLGLIPSNVATAIRENGADEVIRQAGGVRDAVEGLPTEHVINLRGVVNMPTAQEMLDAAQVQLQNRSVRVPMSFYVPRGTANP